MESEAEKFRKTLEKDTFHEEGIALKVKPTDRVGREGFTLVHWTCHYGRTEVRVNHPSAISFCYHNISSFY